MLNFSKVLGTRFWYAAPRCKGVGALRLRVLSSVGGDGGNGKRTDDCISSRALGAGLLRTGPAVEKSTQGTIGPARM